MKKLLNKGGKMTKKYVISSTEFQNLKAAEEKIREWEDDKTLDPFSMVYEVTTKTKKYKPALKLEEVK